MGPEPSVLVVHCEGVGDDILSIPFLDLIRRAFASHSLTLLVATGRRDLFLGLEEFRVIETCEVQRMGTALSSYYEFIFDLSTGYFHISDMFNGFDFRYGTYVDFAKPTTVEREVAVHRSPTTPMWKQFLALAGAVGIHANREPELPFIISDLSMRYASLLVDLRCCRPLICLAPGAASDPAKRWCPEHFVALILLMHSVYPCHFALLGSKNELALGDEIVGKLVLEIDNLIGLTTLGCAAYILKNSELLVSNDNGLMHLGALLGTPTIGLFGPSNSQKWRPIGPKVKLIEAKTGDVNDIAPEEVILSLQSDILGLSLGNFPRVH